MEQPPENYQIPTVYDRQRYNSMIIRVAQNFEILDWFDPITTTSKTPLN